MTTDFAPFLMQDGWYFFADGRSHGPYRSMATAYQRREDVLAYTATAVVACHCRVVAQ